MPVPRFEFTLSEGPRILRSLQLTVAADEWGWDEFEVANGASDASILPGSYYYQQRFRCDCKHETRMVGNLNFGYITTYIS